jgi:hypothetical protein
MPARSRRNMHLASTAGSDASAPMSPAPTTELPSLTTSTLLPLIVRSQARSGSWWMAMQTRATPGVYAIERSSRPSSGTRFCIVIFPPTCERKTRSLTLITWRPSTSSSAPRIARPCSASRA